MSEGNPPREGPLRRYWTFWTALVLAAAGFCVPSVSPHPAEFVIGNIAVVAFLVASLIRGNWIIRILACLLLAINVWLLVEFVLPLTRSGGF